MLKIVNFQWRTETLSVSSKSLVTLSWASPVKLSHFPRALNRAVQKVNQICIIDLLIFRELNVPNKKKTWLYQSIFIFWFLLPPSLLNEHRQVIWVVMSRVKSWAFNLPSHFKCKSSKQWIKSSSVTRAPRTALVVSAVNLFAGMFEGFKLAEVADKPRVKRDSRTTRGGWSWCHLCLKV